MLSDRGAETVWQIFAPPEGSRIAWMARRPEILGGGLDSLAQMRAFAKRYERDCYFSPNPVAGDFGRRPSTVHVTHVRFVVIDLDPVHKISSEGANGSGQTVGSGKEFGVDRYDGGILQDSARVSEGYQSISAEREVLEHAENLLGIRLHPDRIDSGRGKQLWLRFDPVPVATQEEKSQWRGAVGAFLHRLDQDLGVVGGCRVDTSCCDLPRLVRLPGTVNSKTGRTAAFNEVGAEHGDLFRRILDRFGLPPAPRRSACVSAGDWRPHLHLLSGRAKEFLSHGCGEPGRHSAAYSAAASMRDLGAGYEATEAAVLRGAGKCSPPLSHYEAKRCVQNAFKEGGLIGS